MGDRVTDEPETIGETFDRVFPDYLIMGMTPEQFWDGESWLKKHYRAAYRQRMRNEERIRDQQAWLTGIYIRDAIQSVAVLVNGFVPKGASPAAYPEVPRLEKAEKEKAETDKRKREELQMQRAMAMFQTMVSGFNRNFEKKQKEQEQKATRT